MLGKTEQGIREDLKSYFVEWEPAYERFVQVHYRWTLSGEYPRLAWSAALTAQMAYEQPVVHEFPLVEPPTLLVIGQEDRTALGAGRVDAETRRTLGQYPELSRRAAGAIPDAELIELENVGHIPHIAAPERWHEALHGFLEE